MRQTFATRARERSGWDAQDGSLTDFLSGLDPGPGHEWVRSALEVQSKRSYFPGGLSPPRVPV